MHFHELCRHLGKAAGLDIPPPPAKETPDPAYYENVLPDLLSRATERLGPRYDAVLVDEAQDFRERWWPQLLGLHRDPDHGYLFLFADSSQNLYGGSVPVPADAAEVPLPSNLRNTQPINEFVSVFHEGEVAPVGRGPRGRPVEVLAYENPEDLGRLLTVVLKNLQEEDVSLDDVVVLTPVAGSKSALREMGKVDGYRFAEEPEPGTVLIGTIQGFKGLERPVVVLAELDERSEERLAQLLYVGGSRARNHLIVLATVPVARTVRALTKATGP
jgi:superfamily I DNA/RNA helicase